MSNPGKAIITTIGTGVKTAASSVPKVVKRKAAPNEKMIGVVFSNVAEYAAPAILRAMNETMSAHGYALKVRDAFNSQAKEERILKEMIAAKVDGLIIEPSKSQMLCKHIDMYRMLDRKGIPYVFLRSNYPQMIDHPKLLVNDGRGSYLVTRHLIATGRKKIVGFFKADDALGIERHKGYVEAIQEAGRSYDPEFVIWFHSEERFKRPTLALEQLLKKYPDCDAVVCYNDNMALAVIKYLQGKGYRVPADIAVTGYGNYAVCEPGGTHLTSVEMPYQRIGENVCSMLLRLMSQESADVSDLILDPELVIRSSSTL